MIETGPTVPESRTLIAHAQGILEAVQTTFEQEQVELPERQFITVGGAADVAWDCEQVAVAIEQVYNGLPGQQGQAATKCNEPRTVVATVSIVRCIPLPKPNGRTGITPVEPDIITASAETFLADAWLLILAGQLFGDEQSFLGSMADVTIGQPQGGFQATTLTLLSAAV